MVTGIAGVVFYIACIAGAGSIGSRKGRPVLGIVLGILLLPVGVIIIALIPAKRITYDWQALRSTDPEGIRYGSGSGPG
jgi:hypothetical protein